MHIPKLIQKVVINDGLRTTIRGVDIQVRLEDGRVATVAQIRYDVETVRVKLLDKGYIAIVPNGTRDVSVNLES